MSIDWNAALEAIAADIITIANHEPKERLPKEEQARSVLANWFRANGATATHFEAGYSDVDKPGQHPECDLRVVLEDGREIWMEMKGGTADAPSFGYNAKPAESLYGWLSDVEKLHGAPEGAKRAFVLVGLRQHGHAGKLFSPGHLDRVTAEIKKSFEAPAIECVRKEVTFDAWREIAPAEIVAHTWIW